MANVRAFRSGLWSDANPTTSPWGTGGVLYAPAANDDVYSNTYTIHVDQNVTVLSVTNGSATSRLWKDGATTTAAAGGTFNLLNGVSMNANVGIGNISVQTILLSGTNSASLSGNITGGAGSANHTVLFSSNGNLNYIGTATGQGTSSAGTAINHTGLGVLNIVGNVYGAQNVSSATGHGINVSGGGSLYATGNIFGGTGASTSEGLGINASAASVVYVTGNVFGGQTSSNNGNGINFSSTNGTVIVVGNITGNNNSTAAGLNNSSTGTAIVVGNVIATSATNAFVSSNASAINKISGNIYNHPNGTAAIYATRYTIDPVPKNGLIQYSNLNQFTTDSLSAFSMPPVSSVRIGTTFANGTLTGTCAMPSPNSVVLGTPVDDTIGTAIVNPLDVFSYNLSAISTSNTIGIRLKNCLTTESTGELLASFNSN